MKLTLIAAMARNHVIGSHGDIPWYLPADLKYFKKMTMGKPVIMGRKTFDSIGKPLPGRDIIVITRNPDAYKVEGVQVVDSIDAAIAAAGDVPEIMIAGGAEIYQQTIARADHMYITRVDGVFEGDAFFPEFDPLDWIGGAATSHLADADNPHDYDFLRYDRF